MTTKYDSREIIEFGKNVLLECGFPEDHAESAARILVTADLRGTSSHGMVGGDSLDVILAKVKNQGINPDAKPKILEQKYLTILHIDADGALGHYVSEMAVEKVKEMAHKHGIAKVYVHNSTHFGAAGIYSEQIAEEGDLAGKVTCTAPAWVIPYLGYARRIGTNPISWSVPYYDKILTIDIATSQKAGNRIIEIAKLKRDKPVDLREMGLSDYIAGPDGEVINELLPEHDVEFIITRCSALPLGGKHYGHKGYGLGLLIEIDNIIGGGNTGFIAPGGLTPAGRVAQTFEAYVLDSYLSKEDIWTRIDYNLQELGRYGGPEMKLPGQQEWDLAADRMKNGIPYTAEHIKRLKEIGENSGVPFDIKPMLE